MKVKPGFNFHLKMGTGQNYLFSYEAAKNETKPYIIYSSDDKLVDSGESIEKEVEEKGILSKEALESKKTECKSFLQKQAARASIKLK